MADNLIDLKALLVEREDFDAGTVTRLRDGLAQGGTQFKALRDAADALKRKLDSAPPDKKPRLHLKSGIANYFLGHLGQAVSHLRQADTGLGSFHLGLALVARKEYEDALAAFDKAEQQKYSASKVQLQRAGVYRLLGDVSRARGILADLERAEKLSSHEAEYHFQLAGCHEADGDRPIAIKHLERAVELQRSHTGALFQLGYLNDQAGNDEEAIEFYERALKYPPIYKGTLYNLGVLYEDNEKYDKAVECFNRLHRADYNDDRARLFLKDAQAAQTQGYDPADESLDVNRRQVLETPVTDFELSVRARNCLKKMNIRTLGDLTRVTEAQLMASKNFGETSLDEIKEIMTAKGLKIGQSIETGNSLEGGGGGSPAPTRYRAPQQLSAEEQAQMNRSVGELNLSVRARKCMLRLNINTIGELVSRTADELLEAKNFGQTSLHEVREKLTALGMKLRGD